MQPEQKAWNSCNSSTRRCGLASTTSTRRPKPQASTSRLAVSKRLVAYAGLEADLAELRRFRFEFKRGSTDRETPAEIARMARRAAGLGPKEPVRDICGLLEKNGVKLLLLGTKRDSFFGLSVGARDGGPAVQYSGSNNAFAAST